LRARIVLTLHDEIVVNVHRDDIDAAARLLRDVMSVAVSRAMPPLPVRLQRGHCWSDLAAFDAQQAHRTTTD
jgi:DNA polymerase I-like protein with 3'-5' exonuclease and polymerase domains